MFGAGETEMGDGAGDGRERDGKTGGGKERHTRDSLLGEGEGGRERRDSVLCHVIDPYHQPRNFRSPTPTPKYPSQLGRNSDHCHHLSRATLPSNTVPMRRQ